jgi:hypothetical protein
MPISNQREEIDERILRLIGLEDVFDLDYDTYLTLLKEAIVKGSFGSSKIPEEELALLANERKRIRGNEGRFEVKKKKITANSFGVGSARATIVPRKRLLPSAIGKSPIAGNLSEELSIIASSLTSIVDTLKAQKKVEEDTASFNRRKEEQEKRSLAESKLEKRFEGLKKAAEKIIAPVKSLLDRILEFFTKILLGRIVYNIIEWFGKKENADKVKSIIRFLGDNWPKLLALYIAFGTSFGKFARGLIGVVIKGTGALIKGAAALAARAGIKGAAGALKFLGGPKGKLIGAGLELAAVAGGTFALSKGLENFGGIGEETPKAGFSGGGFANFKNLFGGFFNGLVSGQKGIDKVPAMLTDGEFVMSRGAVQKYGVDTLEAMNAAGGGTNRPKVVQGTTYAAGGGMIGEKPKPPELKKEAESGLVKTKPTFGPGAMPQMSSSEDMNKRANQITFEERLKRIENQMQVQSAIASGKGINIRGATSGAQLGTGYSAKYQGRNSIVIKGGAKNFSTGIGDREITLGGKRYYAQKKGDDVIYSLAQAGGSLVSGSGLKGIDKSKLPPTQIMMGGDGKPFIGFLAFEKGQPVYKRGAAPGTGTTNPMEALGRWLNPNAYRENDKKMQERKKREAEVNSLEYYKSTGMTDSSIQKQMKATGQNYTRASNDLNFRKNTQAKVAPSKPSIKTPGPLPRPKPSAPQIAGGGMGGKRGSGARPSTARISTPSFSATTKGMRSKQETLGLMR